MRRQSILLFFFLFSLNLAKAFLFGGGGGNNCNACCPPPIPCNCVPQQAAPCQQQSYAPPPQSQCPCAAARVHDQKTVTARPLDELELRAQVSGVRLDQQPTLDSQIIVPRQLELLERLGDDQQNDLNRQRYGPPQAQSYFSSPNVRFSPQQSTKEEQASPASIDEETPEDATTKMVDQSTTPEPLLSSNEQINDETHDIKCNSNVLKKIMLDKMTENSAVSKRQINVEAEKIFGGNIDVICSRGHFSYIYSSSLYCEATKNETTCIAFRQTKV